MVCILSDWKPSYHVILLRVSSHSFHAIALSVLGQSVSKFLCCASLGAIEHNDGLALDTNQQKVIHRLRVQTETSLCLPQVWPNTWPICCVCPITRKNGTNDRYRCETLLVQFERKKDIFANLWYPGLFITIIFEWIHLLEIQYIWQVGKEKERWHLLFS